MKMKINLLDLISILILDFEHTHVYHNFVQRFLKLFLLSLSLLKIYRLDGLRERIIFINANILES